MDNPKKEDPKPLFEDAISVYTQEQAIEDGVLIFVGFIGKQRVVFSHDLFLQGYDDEAKRRVLVEKGVELICLDDLEDSPEMRLRVIEKGKIWAIWHVGEGFTFLRPEDY